MNSSILTRPPLITQWSSIEQHFPVLPPDLSFLVYPNCFVAIAICAAFSQIGRSSQTSPSLQRLKGNFALQRLLQLRAPYTVPTSALKTGSEIFDFYLSSKKCDSVECRKRTVITAEHDIFPIAYSSKRAFSPS